ncbi:NAD-dependent epimerase/dehydratase family protein [Microbacter margulisiae]|uniref:Nucleoside-diphosphate-sugar epimerase n=1 Tax=Microbacter margulisiae TaxID=1350067 RepID=A0A7W5H2F0_9PORP|nr:NAD-dependent epimerase/dehydratase family protein [Microbacter margulisiae]MBB3187685.1 nucleoside-diphosphate-sugar epimerase [Microbacter margulisiae]
MKVLFIGGTGNISTSVSQAALANHIELFHLNRGSKHMDGVTSLRADIRDVEAVKTVLKSHTWDCVVDWIAFTPDEVERDFQLFHGKTRQYIFISSASAYQKPLLMSVITESTPLKNPFWDYSRNKIACEDLLAKHYREDDFPVTIVRPSHTYRNIIPATLGGSAEYTVVDRIRKGLPIVVHGDGTSPWTLTHADDFAKAFIGLIGNDYAIGEAFHITSNEALSWDRIHHYLAEAVGCEANIVHATSEAIAAIADAEGIPTVRGSLLGDKSYPAVFDNTKIKRFVPSFRASIPFAQGIRQTIAWFEADPARMIVNERSNHLIDRIVESCRIRADQ